MKKQLALSLLLFGSTLTVLAFQMADPKPSSRIFAPVDGNEQWLEVRPGYTISAEAATARIPEELDWGSDDELRLIRTQEDEIGFTHYRYRQFRRGIKIEATQVLLHERNRQLVSLNGKWVSGEDKAATSPTLTAEEAVARALEMVNAQRYLWEDAHAEQMLKKITGDPNATAYPEAELVLVDPGLNFQAQKLQLAFKVEVSALQPLSQQILYIDATNGTVLLKLNDLHSHNTPGQAKTLYSGTRTIVADSLAPDTFRLRETTRGQGIETYDMRTLTNYDLADDFYDENNFWNDEEGTQNGAAGDAHWGATMTFDYFSEYHNYIGVDGAGMPLINYINYDNNYGNAFWNGRWATFGNGDGDTFGSSLATVDIVAHEFVHGVTDKTADLIYRNESGALNESFSDIFGVLVEFYATPESADWFIGEDATVDENGIRNMADPNTENDPDTYRGRFWFTETGAFGAGVHTNSGVQNYWFHLLAEGGEGINDNDDAYSVSGIGLDAAGAIAFRNLRFYLSEASTYADARRGALRSAEDLYGECSAELAQSTNAWHAVGVGDPYPRFDLRGVRIDYPATTINCGFPKDGQIQATVSFENCISSLASGKRLPIAFQVDDQPVVRDTVVLTEELSDGDLLSFTFQKPAPALSESGVFELKVWPDLDMDNIRYNDTLRMKVDNVPDQNTDLAVRDIRHPFSGCYLSGAQLEVAIAFLGCDSLPANTPVDISYQVNDGTVLTENITTPYTLYRGEEFTFTFDNAMQIPQQGANEVSAWLRFAPDSLVRNDSLRRIISNPVPVEPFGRLTFEGGATLVDSFFYTTGANASLSISEEAAFEGDFGIRITGSNSFGAFENGQYSPPQSDEDIWTANPTYNTTFCFCTQVPEVEEPLLRFSLQQRHSPAFTLEFSVTNRSMNALRVLVDGEQVDNVFTPGSPLDNNWYLQGVSLSDYAGQDVEICFQTHTGLAPEFDPFSVGDVIYVDDILIGDLALSTEKASITDTNLSIFPNPAQDAVQLKYQSPQPGEVQLRVLSLNGQHMQEQAWEVISGENTLELSTATLPDGVYMVQILHKGYMISRRLIKL